MEITDSLFYTNAIAGVGQEVEIDGVEADHALRSRRIRAGQVLFVTNGTGTCARATVIDADLKQHKLRAEVDEIGQFPVRNPRLVLASSLPKGERQSTLLNMATQLGISEFIPLDCDRSVVRFREKMMARWQKLVAEACKQSRNCNFPVIRPGCSLDSLVADASEKISFVVGDSGGESLQQIRAKWPVDVNALVLVVGPEGGFSKRETVILDNQNSLKLRLSNQILRTETAAVSLIAVVNQAIWPD